MAEQEEHKEEEDEELPSPYRNRFKNEEELLNYYELKAVDVGDNFEVDDDVDDSFFYEKRRPSWEMQLKRPHHRKDNLNDSRNHDFDGFEDVFD